jgi:predicted esterase
MVHENWRDIARGTIAAAAFAAACTTDDAPNEGDSRDPSEGSLTSATSPTTEGPPQADGPAPIGVASADEDTAASATGAPPASTAPDEGPSASGSVDAPVETADGGEPSSSTPAEGNAGEGGAGTAGAAGTANGGPAGAGQGGSGNSEGGTGAGGRSGGPASDAGAAGSGDTGEVSASSGCGATPTLQDSPSTNQFNYNTLTSGGVERRYVLRLPEDYDETRPHRLILGFHGATNNAGHVAGNPAFFGLYELSQGSTIFIAPEAVDGLWSDTADLTLVDDILEQVEADLCIDTSRIIVQGFSQGAAMVRVLACARPGVFRAAVGHSAGGLPLPQSCDPIPYLGSLGLQENGAGGGQLGQTELFATAAGCTIETFPDAPSGGHACSDYQGCSETSPVRWCSFDAGHTPLPNDNGEGSSWMPEEVWSFVTQF